MDLIPIKLSVTNYFIIENGESYVLVDTGCEEDWGLFCEGLNKAGVELSQFSRP